MELTRFWSDHTESNSTTAPCAWGSSMSDLFTRVKLGPSRRQFLQTRTAAGAPAMLPASHGKGEAFAQSAGDTLINAAPATPEGLDILLDVSVGSTESLGALY